MTESQVVPVSTTNLFKLSELQLGDSLVISGDDGDYTALLIMTGTAPCFALRETSSEPTTVVQLIGTTPFAESETEPFTPFRPGELIVSGHLVVIPVGESHKPSTICLGSLAITRDGTTIFKA